MSDAGITRTFSIAPDFRFEQRMQAKVSFIGEEPGKGGERSMMRYTMR